MEEARLAALQMNGFVVIDEMGVSKTLSIKEYRAGPSTQADPVMSLGGGSNSAAGYQNAIEASHMGLKGLSREQLTAMAGRNLSTGTISQVGCSYWRQGTCTRGSNCFYKHDPAEFEIELVGRD